MWVDESAGLDANQSQLRDPTAKSTVVMGSMANGHNTLYPEENYIRSSIFQQKQINPSLSGPLERDYFKEKKNNIFGCLNGQKIKSETKSSQK